jgi:hypothetical protein
MAQIQIPAPTASVVDSIKNFLFLTRNATIGQVAGSITTALTIAVLFLTCVSQVLPLVAPNATPTCTGTSCPVDLPAPSVVPDVSLPSPEVYGAETGAGEVVRADNNTRLNWAAAVARETRGQGGAQFLVGCAGPLNATQQKYASIGLDAGGCAITCGVEAAADGIAGTANSDAIKDCFIQCATAKGFQVVVEVLKDIVTGATGGGWFGTADVANTHQTVYTVRLVKPL